jgi:pyruvate dehydrogenase E2 component (dihydrolipoamide acetyltransferase)
MPIPITIPRLGWNMDEGTFAGWLKQDGDAIRPGDRVFSLESEKATEEIECLDGGTLHIPAEGPKPGGKLPVGTVIGYLLQPGESVADVKAQSSIPKTQTTSNREVSNPKPNERPEKTGGRTISPRARRVAREAGIDWTALRGTGRTGRIRERDVREAVGAVSPIRRVIAERMLASVRSTAPVTLTTTADATNLVRLRAQFKSDETVPSYNDILVKLTATALGEHPWMNSRWDENRIVLQESIHIGIAVDTDAGLLVPVIRDANRLSLAEIAVRSRELIARTRASALRADEMRGGTFTITNLGAFGIDAFTPIIHSPECAILGGGRIARIPIVRGDEVVAGDVMTLSLTFDHRIVDGAPAAQFLQALVRLIEGLSPTETKLGQPSEP